MALSQNSNLITTSKVTRASLEQLSNNMVIASKVDWSYSKEFGRPTEMIGDTLLVRRPILKNVQVNNMVWAGNLPFEGKSALQVNTSFTVPLSFQDADLVLKIEDFKKRFIDQAVISMANVMDSYVYGIVINGVANTVGQYGTAITSDTILAAKELLDAYNTPADDMTFGILTPKLSRNLSNAQLTLFNAQREIADIYLKGRIGYFAGVDWAVSNSSPFHADGTAWTGLTSASIGSLSAATGYLTSGWAETSTISVTGFTAGQTVNVGDVFYLSGATPVYSFNPLTDAQLPYVQQFVVLTAVASTTSASQALVITPALIAGGDYQNIVDPGTTVGVVGYTSAGSAKAGQEGIVFHKTAVGIASPELIRPKNEDEGWSERDPDTNISIRYIRQFMSTGAYTNAPPTFVTRLDAFLGAKVLRPEWCVRIRG